MDGELKIIVNFICDCCGNSYRTEEARDNHINQGCYVRAIGQFKLSNVSEYFDAHKCCPRNPFCIYFDSETEKHLDLTIIGRKFIFHKQYNYT